MRIQYKMKEIMKNIEKAQVLTLRDQVAYGEGQVVSKTLAQNDAVSITLFAFDKGEEISSHKSGGDAFVTCLDGEGEITIDGVNYTLTEGQSIVMPAGHPHAVRGKERFKMLLVVVFCKKSAFQASLGRELYETQSLSRSFPDWKISCAR